LASSDRRFGTDEADWCEKKEIPKAIIASVEREIASSLRVKEAFLRECAAPLAGICEAVAGRLAHGGKVLLFGNGGSAGDAEHIAAEFVGRYQRDRRALPALALATNGCTLTALANDYGYDSVFARQVGRSAHLPDVAIGISTSGNSLNVLGGIRAAHKVGMLRVAFTGKVGGKAFKMATLSLRVPSDVTARIQECHILAGHVLSGYCEHFLCAGPRAVSR
jgi:D-sedoheptulose 7-phosphate isomerase